MNWKRYGQWQQGNAVVLVNGEDHVFRYDLGVVTTGRQRVFHRYYVRIRLPDGVTLSGEDEYGLRAALFDLDRQLQERAMILIAVGLESEWSESCLSFNSAYGYIAQCDHAVNMMDMPPPRDRNPEDGLSVDAMIREAISGMSFGRSATGS